MVSVLHSFDDFVRLGMSGFALAKVLGDAGPDSVDFGLHKETVGLITGYAVFVLFAHASLVVFLD